VDPTLSTDGTLTFRNAAVDVKAATPPERYELKWFRFDNTTDQRMPVGEPVTVPSGSARAPNGVMVGEFLGVTVTAAHPGQPGWLVPSTFFFRRAGGSPSPTWSLVGVERGPANSRDQEEGD
jgi:hypothetical protein